MGGEGPPLLCSVGPTWNCHVALFMGQAGRGMLPQGQWVLGQGMLILRLGETKSKVDVSPSLTLCNGPGTGHTQRKGV